MATYEEMKIGMVIGEIDPWEFLEKAAEEGPTRGVEAEYEEEYAWDDVNGIPLPFDKVKEARVEEMEHMKGKIFSRS